MEKRTTILIVSIIVFLLGLYFSARDITDMYSRRHSASIPGEEDFVPDFLPPDTVFIKVENPMNEFRKKKDVDVIWGVVMKIALSGTFLGWSIYKFRQEKRLTEWKEREKRKNRMREINMMLDKEKRRKRFDEADAEEEKEGDDGLD